MIQKIKEMNPIVEVAEEFGLELKKEGNWYVSHCVFHDDTSTPNLKFNPYTNSYFCYACNAGTKGVVMSEYKDELGQSSWIDAGSDVIGFVQNVKKCSFQEAIRFLAKRANINIETTENKEQEKQLSIYKENESKQKEFTKNLLQNPQAMNYLKQRGLNEQTIEKYKMGYVSNSKYKNHIVIPLINQYGYIHAFAYRNLDNTKPKYINDSSKIYNKSEYLYGIHEARSAIKSLGYAIIVEGYFDVLLLHQAGITNAVAVCSSSFTEEQMNYLRSLTNHVVLWLDGDEPGLNAMKKSLPKLLFFGFEVDMILSENDMDPADVISSLLNHQKSQIYKYMKEKRTPALYYFVQQIVSEFEKEKIYLQRKAIQQIEALSKDIQNEQTKQWLNHYLQKHLY
ncbi:MAG: CHC2 zinc finger domain-containing protein [Ignavibacterium sp.]|nr:CHC2 zinc finger domain-containing protein [Ignavibacterium sp.]